MFEARASFQVTRENDNAAKCSIFGNESLKAMRIFPSKQSVGRSLVCSNISNGKTLLKSWLPPQTCRVMIIFTMDPSERKSRGCEDKTSPARVRKLIFHRIAGTICYFRVKNRRARNRIKGTIIEENSSTRHHATGNGIQDIYLFIYPLWCWITHDINTRTGDDWIIKFPSKIQKIGLYNIFYAKYLNL